MAVNQGPKLRKPWKIINSQTGKGTRLEQTKDRVNKNQYERVKREEGRHHLERMSYLFRVPNPEKNWTRVDVLSFGRVIPLFASPNICLPDPFQP